MADILFVASGGLGNIIQSTVAWQAIINAGHALDLKLNCDVPDVKEIFSLKGIRKIYVKKDPRNVYDYQMTGPFSPGKKYKAKNFIKSRINYAQHIEEAKVYFDMAKQIGIKEPIPEVKINTGDKGFVPHKDTIAIYPGSKINWAMKRWDKYDELAKNLLNVLVVGTKEDIFSTGKPSWFNKTWDWGNAKLFYDKTLPEIAFTLSKCKMFVGNDGGVAHLAAATGIPTFVLFGPSSHIKNKPYAKNAHVIAIDLPCRPCQFTKFNGLEIFGANKSTCPNNMKCMKDMSVKFVLETLFANN